MSEAGVMSDEQGTLAARHLPTARKIAGEYAAKVPAFADEFRGEAALALCLAAMAFDPARGPKFSQWAAFKVRGAMVDYVRSRLGRSDVKRSRRGGDVTLDFPESCPSNAPVVGWEAEEAEAFAALVAPLDDRPRRLLTAIYRDGLSQKDAGASVGVKEAWASEVHRDALARLRAVHAGAVL